MNNSLFKEIQRFVSNEVSPWIRDHGENVYPEQLVEKMKTLGLFGMNIPKEFGGLELSMSDMATVITLISQGSVSLSSIFGSHFKVCNYIRDFGTPEQKKRLLPNLATGKLIAALAHTEETGKSVENIKTMVTENEQGAILSGSKSFVTNALHADLFAVVAKIDDQQKKSRYVIVLLKKDTPGLTTGSDIPRLGLNLISVCELSLKGCLVDIERDILGGLESDVSKMMESTRVRELIDYTARALGLGKAIIEETLLYIKTKKSGNVLLADIPLVKVRLVEMIMQQASSEMLFNDLIKQDEKEKKSLFNAYIAKAKITEDVVRIAETSLKIHGGKGYTLDCLAERHLRDALGLTIIGMPTDIILNKISETILSEK